MGKAMKGSEELAGEQIIVGGQVSAPGATGSVGGTGLVGAATTAAMRRADSKRHEEVERTSPLVDGQHGYLAVTPTRVLIMEVKVGVLRNSAVKLLDQAPRDQVTDAEVGKGMLNPISITFADGSHWDFSTAKAMVRGVRRVVDELTGTTA